MSFRFVVLALGLLGELAEVFLGTQSVRQAESLRVNHAIGQRDVLGFQVAVDGGVGGIIPSLPLSFAHKGLCALVVAFQQVIEFVQDDSRGLVSAHALQSDFVVVQPPVLIDCQRAESRSRRRDHRQDGVTGEGPVTAGS